MNKQIRADLMLVLVTFCWGISYYLVDVSLTEMEPFTLNMHRFLGAFFLALLLSGKKLKKINKVTIKYSLLTGTTLMLVYFGMTFGVKYTTLTNSGFLCSLTVVFTPLLGWLVWKQKLDKKLKWAVIFCFIGIALLTLNDDFSFNLENLRGDLLSILCALAYAVDLHLTEKAVSRREVDPYLLGVFQLGVTGGWNLLMAVMTETPHFPEAGNVWVSVVFLSVFCTGLAFIIQPIAQQYTTASHVGIIFTLEPVFSAFVAYFLAGEVLTAKAYLGAALMLISILVMEIDFKSLVCNKRLDD